MTPDLFVRCRNCPGAPEACPVRQGGFVPAPPEVRAWQAIRATACALWTTAPPTEPGDWWTRKPGDDSTRLHITLWPSGRYGLVATWWDVRDGTRTPYHCPLTEMWPGAEWCPVDPPGAVAAAVAAEREACITDIRSTSIEGDYHNDPGGGESFVGSPSRTLDAAIRNIRIRARGQAPAPEARPAGVYVASRASVPGRAEMWRAHRADGRPIVSTWIDEAGPGQTADMGDLWARIGREVAASVGLILYAEPTDFPLKGALVEVGMALAAGKPVVVVAPSPAVGPWGSWATHPLVSFSPTITDAFRRLLPAPEVRP